MKLYGEKFDGPNVAVLVLPRNGKDIVFKARAVLDYTRFDALCPKPMPKMVTLPGGGTKFLWDEKSYSVALDHWGKSRTAFTVVESLRATEGLEWEKVDYDNPTTWMDYQKELSEAFFADREIVRILQIVWEANGIDDEKLEEARQRFLLTQAAESSTAV